jgi:hypothetical protein
MFSVMSHWTSNQSRPVEPVQGPGLICSASLHDVETTDILKHAMEDTLPPPCICDCAIPFPQTQSCSAQSVASLVLPWSDSASFPADALSVVFGILADISPKTLVLAVPLVCRWWGTVCKTHVSCVIDLRWATIGVPVPQPRSRSVQSISLPHGQRHILATVYSLSDGDDTNNATNGSSNTVTSTSAGATDSTLPSPQRTSANLFVTVLAAMLGRFRHAQHPRVRLADTVADSDLAEIVFACPDLTAIDLRGCCNVTDEGLAHIANCHPHTIDIGLGGVERIDTYRTGLVAPKGIAQSRCFFSQLTTLNLAYCENVSVAGICRMADSCHHLRSLTLEGCDHVTDSSLADIAASYPRLNSLDVSWCSHITDAGIIKVALGCRQLAELQLGFCWSVTDYSVVIVATNCRELRMLNLEYCYQITDEALSSAATWSKQLQTIRLRSCSEVTDSGLAQLLLGCPRLRADRIISGAKGPHFQTAITISTLR